MRLTWAWSLALLAAAGTGCQVTHGGDDAGRTMDAPRDVGTDVPPIRCTTASECNDSIPCTTDTCEFGGVCRNQPLDGLCASGEHCDPVRGCTTSTADCTTSDDCMVGRGFCDGTWVCIAETCYLSEPRDCDDGNDCTTDVCDPAASGGTGGCTYESAAGCDAGAVVGDGGGPVCDPFDPATGYSGVFRISPPQLLDCSILISYNLQNLTFSVSGGTLTVTGAPSFPATLTGPAPTGASFTVNGSSDCATFSLTGTFSCSNVFMGTFTRSLSGDCAICGGGSSSILGRR